MASRTTVSTLVLGMFLTGCANSLLTKYQDKACVEHCDPFDPLPAQDFEQPVSLNLPPAIPSEELIPVNKVWQTLNMFIGEFGCCLPLIWRYFTSNPKRSPFSKATNDSQGYTQVAQDEGEPTPAMDVDEHLTGWRIGLLWFPAFCDICGTTLMNVGLILCPVSIYQMSRGALVLWVGVLSVVFLRRHLWLYQWLSLVIVTLGVCLVGLSGSLVKKELGSDAPSLVAAVMHIAKRADDDPAKVALGVLLILFAQVFTASQYVVEEKIMSRFKVEPLLAVTYEGFFGLVTTLAAMPLLHMAFHDRSVYFDIPKGWHQIIHTPRVFWTCIAIMISIGSFNFFGLSVTSRVSATARSLIDTCRTLGIWIVSLAIGWENLVFPLSLLQVAGFAMLVYGTSVFNGLIAPACFAPPPELRLPHEPELEETGAVPAAANQGRAGYDVLPTDDEGRS